MSNSINKNSYKIVLFVFAIFIGISSVYAHQLDDYMWYRGLRGIVSFTALAVLLYYKKRHINYLLAGFLFLYGASSIVTIWYENTSLASLSMILNLMALLFLIKALYPKVSFKNMSWWLIIIFVVLVLFNGFLLYEFVAMMKSYTSSSTQYLFMLLGAMSLVVVGFLALLYNYQHSSKSSLLLVLSVFLIIFSEVFRGIAYYDFAFGDIAVYMARVLLIIGSFLLVHFCLLEKPKDEALSKKLF